MVTVTSVSLPVAGVSTGVGSWAVAVNATCAFKVPEVTETVPVAGSVPSNVTVTTVLLFGVVMVVGFKVKCVLLQVSAMGLSKCAPLTVKVCVSWVLVKFNVVASTVKTGSNTTV